MNLKKFILFSKKDINKIKIYFFYWLHQFIFTFNIFNEIFIFFKYFSKIFLIFFSYLIFYYFFYCIKMIIFKYIIFKILKLLITKWTTMMSIYCLFYTIFTINMSTSSNITIIDRVKANSTLKFRLYFF